MNSSMKKTRREKTSKMAEWVKALAAKIHNLSPDPHDGRKGLTLESYPLIITSIQ